MRLSCTFDPRWSVILRTSTAKSGIMMTALVIQDWSLQDTSEHWKNCCQYKTIELQHSYIAILPWSHRHDILSVTWLVMEALEKFIILCKSIFRNPKKLSIKGKNLKKKMNSTKCGGGCNIWNATVWSAACYRREDVP